MRRASLFLVAALLLVAAPARATDAGWQSPDTLRGLLGSYTRPPFGAGNIAFLTLNGSDGYRAQGPYTRFFDAGSGILALQNGSYSALGENPAIGAYIRFDDEAGNFRDLYSIIGIKRDPLGQKIVAIELVDFRDGKVFSLVRVGL
ncbi:MAG TPA: hypothetical protein VHB97_01455 [Polyangia bacterium]|jgi:hypothetical protein|nr:hypothetical protein [Polyangia bacterium]